MKNSPGIANTLLYIPRLAGVALASAYYSIRTLITMAIGRNTDKFHRFTYRWAKVVLAVCGVRYSVYGKEKLKAAESYIYASNHSSMFDIPILIASLNDKIRIIYKKELEKVPFFGWGLASSPYIAIERSDPRKSMKSMEEAIEAIKTGSSVIIYPEGTRSKDGRLQQFKRGAFMLASRSGKPIVPITLLGTKARIPMGTKIIRSGRVEVIIHEPIETIPQNKKEETLLMDRVRTTIASSLPDDN